MATTYKNSKTLICTKHYFFQMHKIITMREFLAFWHVFAMLLTKLAPLFVNTICFSIIFFFKCASAIKFKFFVDGPILVNNTEAKAKF